MDNSNQTQDTTLSRDIGELIDGGVARREAERAALRPHVEPVIEPGPTPEELAARDLKERREAAGVEAYKATISTACEKLSEDYSKTDEAFKVCAADPGSTLDELFAGWSALRDARASYAQACELRNATNPNDHPIGAGTPIPLLFSEVEEQVLSFRAKNVANATVNAAAQTAEDARADAARKITK